MSPLVQYIIVGIIVILAVIGLWRALRRGNCHNCSDSSHCSGCTRNDCPHHR